MLWIETAVNTNVEEYVKYDQAPLGWLNVLLSYITNLQYIDHFKFLDFFSLVRSQESSVCENLLIITEIKIIHS